MEKYGELFGNITAEYDQKGQQWFTRLPGLVQKLCVRYQLTNFKVLPNLTWSYVAQAEMPEHGAVIVKICPNPDQLKGEFDFLQAYSATGICPQTFLYDEECVALIQSRLQPGYSLKKWFPSKDEQSVDVAIDLMQRHQQVSLNPNEVKKNPHISEWLEPLLRQTSSIVDKDLAQDAGRCAKNLLASADKEVLLHGDLHHGNILYDQCGGWRMIDPQGVIGEPAVEIAAFLRNPRPDFSAHDDMALLLQLRINRFSQKLMIDPLRIRSWGFVLAALASHWAVQSPIPRESFLKVAYALRLT